MASIYTIFLEYICVQIPIFKDFWFVNVLHDHVNVLCSNEH